ncbi:protein kinase domain-containing protein [Pajaroellobacter abortibovis]|uniref:Protein kinase domain-containing protein n=1 Tax=Pajaroellobacter abortibovis TaxID=1882918 RepID=A0A1L6MW81_9BACT|nr:protein kinase [Pajaroellobacter abortibovis]APR99800.1 hypothetical protein BCY86_03245 [Pajaroellobacter abortibovis]
MPWNRSYKVLEGILSGLEAMHQVGIGHLDLTHANVIIAQRQRAVLVDFGLSRYQVRQGRILDRLDIGFSQYGRAGGWSINHGQSRRLSIRRVIALLKY